MFGGLSVCSLVVEFIGGLAISQSSATIFSFDACDFRVLLDSNVCSGGDALSPGLLSVTDDSLLCLDIFNAFSLRAHSSVNLWHRLSNGFNIALSSSPGNCLGAWTTLQVVSGCLSPSFKFWL